MLQNEERNDLLHLHHYHVNCVKHSLITESYWKRATCICEKGAYKDATLLFSRYAKNYPILCFLLDVFYTCLNSFLLVWGIKIFHLLFFHLPFFIYGQCGWWSVSYVNCNIGRGKSSFIIQFMIECVTRIF